MDLVSRVFEVAILPSRRQVLGGLALAPFVSSLPMQNVGNAEAADTLASAAQITGRYFGAAVRMDQIAQDDKLRQALLRDCFVLTPEIHLKWDAVERTQGRYTFGPADELVSFAARNDLKVRGHTLLWDKSTPQWAKTKLVDGRDWNLLADYFAAVLSRYSKSITQWDVINEPIDVDGDSNGLRINSFYRAFGPDYIPRALREARKNTPAAKLMINDYSFDYDNDVESGRRRQFVRLLERLKRQGVPIDGVGIQAHLDLSKGPLSPRIIRDFIGQIASLGLEIVITELDVKEFDCRAPLKVRDQRVADETRKYLDIVLSERAVKGVITWGLSDRNSWLQGEKANQSLADARAASTGPGFNRGLPYDVGLNPKPMYGALKDAFRARDLKSS